MAVLSCGAKTLKYSLFIFNLIFVIAGIICLGVGIWLALDRNASHQLAKVAESMKGTDQTDLAQQVNFVRDTGIILCVGAAIILAISFLGCCGAVKEWRPLLVLYAACLMIILAVELAAIIFAAANKDNIEDQFRDGMKATLDQWYNGTDSEPLAAKKTWDEIMRAEKCCGVEAKPDDFARSDWKRRDRNHLKLFPPACCPETSGVDVPCTTENQHTKGCYESIKDEVMSQIGVVIGVSVIIALIQIVGMVFALCLCAAITRGGDVSVSLL